jgi:hypothetical protein
MTDTITSQNIDLSSWDTLYIYNDMLCVLTASVETSPLNALSHSTHIRSNSHFNVTLTLFVSETSEVMIEN